MSILEKVARIIGVICCCVGGTVAGFAVEAIVTDKAMEAFGLKDEDGHMIWED